MGRRPGPDVLRDREKCGHREVCRAVSAQLAREWRVGAGFPEGGEGQRETVLPECQLQGTALAFHAGPDRPQALRGEDLHAPAKLWRGKRHARVAAGPHQPCGHRLSRMDRRLRWHSGEVLRARHRRRCGRWHDPGGARAPGARPKHSHHLYLRQRLQRRLARLRRQGPSLRRGLQSAAHHLRSAPARGEKRPSLRRRHRQHRPGTYPPRARR